MLYTAGEILLFLIAAAALGIAIGWIAKGLSQRGKLEAGFERDISSRQLRINTLEDELRETQDEAEAAQAALEEAKAQIEQERAAALTIQARLDEAEAAAGEMRMRLELLTQEVEALRAAAVGSDAERAPLEAQLQELSAQIEAKDRQLADLQARARQAPDGSQAPEPPSGRAQRVPAATWQDMRSPGGYDDSALDVEGTLAEPAEETGRLAFPAGTAQPLTDPATAGEEFADDDLKRIHGIGPKIERTLKALGITSYRQIAQLTEADIDALGDQLGHFRDRIRRDDWMASAAKLHRETHGTEP